MELKSSKTPEYPKALSAINRTIVELKFLSIEEGDGVIARYQSYHRGIEMNLNAELNTQLTTINRTPSLPDLTLRIPGS